jgi:SAM-dependent methyltransferase
VIGIDISPELVRLAEARIQLSGVEADVVVGSAYETGIPNGTVDVIFCAALIHHLDIPRVRAEMLRILREGGFVVLSEPIRFSKLYDRLRKLLPARPNISEYEHPLTTAEFKYMLSGFEVEDLRYFRLPFVPMTRRWKKMNYFAHNLSAWLIAKIPAIRYFGTSAVVRLRKRTSDEGCSKILRSEAISLGLSNPFVSARD